MGDISNVNIETVNEIVIDFGDICRFCLLETNNAVRISDNCFSEKLKDLTISKFVEKITAIQINDIEGYPSLVCERCVDLLCTCYEFVTMCNQTQVELEDCYKSTLEKAKAGLKLNKINTPDIAVEDHPIKEEIFHETQDLGVEVILSSPNSSKALNKERNVKFKEIVLSENEDSYCGFPNHSESVDNKQDIKTIKNTGPFHCQFCDKQYVFKNSLQCHVKKHHKELLTQKCNYCPKCYATKSELNYHLGSEHKYLEVICPYCNLTMKVQALEDHCNEFHKLKVQFSPPKKLYVKEEHGDKREFTCEVCGKVLFSKKAYQNHLRHHSKAKEKKDESKAVKLPKKVMETELTEEKPRAFHCDLCNKSFRGKDTLQRHIRTHTGEKDYICEICSKGFYTKSEINRHVRYHRKHYRYICDICTKGFVDKTRFRHHMMAHKNVRPHKCPICNKEFILRGKMKIHLARRHSAVIEEPDEKVKGHYDPDTYIPLDDLLKC